MSQEVNWINPEGMTEEDFQQMMLPRGFTVLESQLLWLFAIVTGTDVIKDPSTLTRKEIVMELLMAGVSWRWCEAVPESVAILVNRILFLEQEYKLADKKPSTRDRARKREFGTLTDYYYFCNHLIADGYLVHPADTEDEYLTYYRRLVERRYHPFTQPTTYADPETGEVRTRYEHGAGSGALLCRMCHLFLRLNNAGTMLKDLKHGVEIDESEIEKLKQTRGRIMKPRAPKPQSETPEVDPNTPKRGRPRKIKTT